MTETTLRRAGLILMATAVLAKVVGFLREAVIAATYGTSHTVDLYLAGMTLPAMAATIVFHSIPNAFVPLFSDAGGTGAARRQARGVLGGMCVLSACIWLLAEPIASLTNSGFPVALRSETVTVLRITSAAVALATIEALTRSRLLARRQFVRPGLSLVWQSVVMIAAVLLYPDGGALTLAWGFVAGSAAATLWNLLPIGKPQTTVPQSLDSAVHPPLPNGIGLWVPIILLADLLPQSYALVDRHLGSYLAEGSIAALQYANLLAVVPVSICGLTLGTAIFPFLSTAIQERDTLRTREILDKAVRWSLIAAVPVTIWLLFLSQEVTGLLYERGMFDQKSRLLTASTLTVYALGLVPNVLMAILAKVYYSLRRWGPVMLSSVLSVGVKAVLSYWWVVPHGTVGLAAASAVGAMVGVLTLVVALPSPLLSGHWRYWLRALLILGVICGIGSTVGRGVSLFLSAGEFAVQAVFRLGLTVIVSLVLAVVIGPRLGLSEIAAVWKWIRRSPV